MVVSILRHSTFRAPISLQFSKKNAYFMMASNIDWFNDSCDWWKTTKNHGCAVFTSAFTN